MHSTYGGNNRNNLLVMKDMDIIIMKRKCMIFGAGNEGKKSFIKINNFFNVLYYIDNNSDLKGKEIKGISIISVNEMKKILNEDSSIVVIISVVNYSEILAQLSELEVKYILIMLGGLLYNLDKNKSLLPYEEIKILPYKKTNLEEKNILYVQNIPCIRTNKIARLVKENGYKVNLLYLLAPTINNSIEYQEIYDNVFTCLTINSLIDFVNNSEFDIIHSSNTPDYITLLIQNSNKKIIHDCHDMLTLQGKNTIDIASCEYIANTRSVGVIYPSEGMKKFAMAKYNLDENKVFVLENYLSKFIKRERNYPKLSSIDGEIHAVYQGGITFSSNSNRYYEVIWKKIAESGIHIHFYSQVDEKYCKYLESIHHGIHFEGNRSSKELASEMTKYDCGLLLFNVNQNTKSYLEVTTPNKLYEYINAGLPVVTCGIESYADFIKKYNLGIELNLNSNIKNQFKRLNNIAIEEDFLAKNGYLMESKIQKLIDFYQRIYEKN